MPATPYNVLINITGAVNSSVVRSISQANRSLMGLQRQVIATNRAIQASFGKLVGLGGMLVGVGSIVEAMKQAVDLSKQNQLLQADTLTILKNQRQLRHESRDLAKQDLDTLNAQAVSLQRQTSIYKNVFERGSLILAQSRLNVNQIESLQPIMANLLASQKMQGKTAEQMEQTYKAVGMAIERGMGKSLSRVGVVLTPTEQKLLQINALTGNISANVLMLEHAITRVHAGAAKTLMGTLIGQTDEALAEMRMSLENMGGPLLEVQQRLTIIFANIVTIFEPIIIKVSNLINDFLKAHMGDLQNWIDMIKHGVIPVIVDWIQNGWNALGDAIKNVSKIWNSFGENHMRAVRALGETFTDWMFGNKFLDPKNKGYGTIRAFGPKEVPKAMPVFEGWFPQLIKMIGDWVNNTLVPAVIDWLAILTPIFVIWAKGVIKAIALEVIRSFPSITEKIDERLYGWIPGFKQWREWNEAQQKKQEEKAGPKIGWLRHPTKYDETHPIAWLAPHYRRILQGAPLGGPPSGFTPSPQDMLNSRAKTQQILNSLGTPDPKDFRDTAKQLFGNQRFNFSEVFGASPIQKSTTDLNKSFVNLQDTVDKTKGNDFYHLNLATDDLTTAFTNLLAILDAGGAVSGATIGGGGGARRGTTLSTLLGANATTSYVSGLGGGKTIGIGTGRDLAKEAAAHYGMYTLVNGSPNLACAEAVSRVMRDAGYNVEATAVNDLVNKVRQSGGRDVAVGTPGGLIYSPTIGTKHGHIGIMGEGGLIWSNRSSGAGFQSESIQSWIKTHGNIQEIMPWGVKTSTGTAVTTGADNVPKFTAGKGTFPASYRAAFEAAGKKYGVDPTLLAAMADFETGHGTSKVFQKLHNVAGLTGPGHTGVGGDYQPFPNVESSIYRLAELVAKKQQTHGLKTLEQLAWDPVYGWAPKDVSNDPRRTNKSWPANVRAAQERIRKEWEKNNPPANVTINYNVTHHHHGGADEQQLAHIHRRHIDQMKRDLAQVFYENNRQTFDGSRAV